MQHLSDTFPNRWTGHGSTINWPPRSPDLTLLAFCLLGWMKSKGCKKKVDTRDDLLDHTMDVIARIKERQEQSDKQYAMSLHKLRSAFMLMVEFSKMYYTR
jgi:hypothetical protein